MSELVSQSSHVKDDRACVLMGAGFETPNLGVSALASGVLTGVAQCVEHGRVVICDYSREERTYHVDLAGKPYTAALLPLRFSWKLWLPNNVFRLLVVAFALRWFPSRWRSHWIGGNRWLKGLDASRVVFGLNGGDSFSDIYGLRRLLYVMLPQLIAIQLRKPLVLLPQTYGPFRSTVARWWARYLLKNATYIGTRDLEGVTEVRTLTKGARQAEFSHDMAFLMAPVRPAEDIVATVRLLKASSQPLIGLNISGLLWMGGYTSDNSFGLCGDYKELMMRLLAHIVKQLDGRVLLIAHVYGENGESDVNAIQECVRTVPGELRERLTFLESRMDQAETKWLIGQCDFFVGSRMHACIGALSQSVPAVGLAYSGKFAGVFRSIGAEALAVDLRATAADAAIERIETAYRSRLEIQENLRKQVPNAVMSVAALFTKVIG
jgi:colanic acid/amylovoran biosynthesis protein